MTLLDLLATAPAMLAVTLVSVLRFFISQGGAQ